MNGKKWLVATGVVVLGVTLFFAATTFAQTDEGGFDRDWAEMMHGDGWEHGPMHAWEDHSEHGADCPYYADHAEHMDGTEGWDSWEEHHDEMHGAYGHMMGDWVQPAGDQDAPAEDSGE